MPAYKLNISCGLPDVNILLQAHSKFCIFAVDSVANRKSNMFKILFIINLLVVRLVSKWAFRVHKTCNHWFCRDTDRSCLPLACRQVRYPHKTLINNTDS